MTDDLSTRGYTDDLLSYAPNELGRYVGSEVRGEWLVLHHRDGTDRWHNLVSGLDLILKPGERMVTVGRYSYIVPSDRIHD